ncbi:MAG: bifunctional metallophosphatase/5'-nucleotidase [Anaerolineales bacterium]|nr:bifunctional metallophosphatase/5'-nucleotidase [Anaerolineales bacterium]
MLRLTILHTNDLHGRVQKLARITTLAKKIDKEVTAQGGHCVLWDAGDAEDTTLLESSLTKGGAMMALLKTAGYDHETLGNASPIRYGPQVVSMLAERLGQPLLCANMFNQKTGELIDGLQPYALEIFGDLKVGVIGLTDPIGAYSIFDLKMGKPLELLPVLIEQIKAKGGKTVFLLSHLSSAVDFEIAKAIKGLDVIIGGHDHQLISPPEIINNTLIVQAGEFGEFLGQLDLDIDIQTGQITNCHHQLIPVDDNIPQDIYLLQTYKTEQENGQQMMQRLIGELLDPFPLQPEQECPAGNLLADALLDRFPEAQIALALPGQWTTGLKAGMVTFGDLYSATRSTSNPAFIELTGGQILQFLNQALKPELIRKKIRPLRGQIVGFPHIAGLSVKYDPKTCQVARALIGQEELHLDQVYPVATTDLEISDYINYLVIPDEKVDYEVPTIMPEMLEEYISRYSPLKAPANDRITKE